MGLALACASAGGCALAQPVSTLAPVIVTATGFEQKLSDVIPSVSVITRDQIDRSGALSLSDLVMGEPGVEVGRNGGLGTTTSFFLRGSESKNVLVLVDGVRMRDGITQSALAENIPLGLVEQIEIIRGNVSAIYGDAAVGGVINIKTREGDGKPRLFVNSSIGERNTRDLTTGYTGSADGLKFSVTAQHTRTDGFPAANSKNGAYRSARDAERDPYENTSIGVRVSKAIGDTSFGVSTLSSRASLKYGASAFGATDPSTSSSNDLLNVFSESVLSRSWTSRIDLSYNRIALNVSDSGVYGTAESPTTRVSEFRFDNRVRLDSSQSLRVGIDHREDALASTSSSLKSRAFDSPYVGYLLSAGRWSGQLNARYDSASTGQSKGTWLAGSGYQLSDAWRLTGSVSTAFRPPSASEISSNSSLIPEFHKSKEVGVGYQDPTISFRSTLFQTETQNPITYNGSSYANANYMRNKGIESFATALLGTRTRLKGSLTLQDPQSPWGDGNYNNATTSARVQSARRAKVHGSLGVTHGIGNTELEANLQGASRRRDTDYDTVGQYKLPGYAVLNLRGLVKIDRELSLIARLDNALDKTYELAYGYNTPPRTAFIGLQYQPAP